MGTWRIGGWAGEEPCTDLAPVLDVLVEPCGSVEALGVGGCTTDVVAAACSLAAGVGSLLNDG